MCGLLWTLAIGLPLCWILPGIFCPDGPIRLWWLRRRRDTEDFLRAAMSLGWMGMDGSVWGSYGSKKRYLRNYRYYINGAENSKGGLEVFWDAQRGDFNYRSPKPSPMAEACSAQRKMNAMMTVDYYAQQSKKMWDDIYKKYSQSVLIDWGSKPGTDSYSLNPKADQLVGVTQLQLQEEQKKRLEQIPHI